VKPTIGRGNRWRRGLLFVGRADANTCFLSFSQCRTIWYKTRRRHFADFHFIFLNLALRLSLPLPKKRGLRISYYLTMASRKKSQGKARKARQAQAASVVEAATLFQGVQIDVNQPQEQRDEVETTCTCDHGYIPIEDGHICRKLIDACLRAADDARKRGENALVAATKATMQDYAEVFQDPDRLQLVISHFLMIGTNCILNGSNDDARWSASFAKYFQFVRDEVSHFRSGTEHAQGASKITELQSADEHTLVKFFRNRINCSCLDKKYKQVKHITKTAQCRNPACKLPGKKVARNAMMYCTLCSLVNYCSRECQVDDWKRHRKECHEYNKKKANIEAIKSELDCKREQSSLHLDSV
jgi:hypothetical protein